MTQYDNRNRGVLFKNTRRTSDKAPDYTGKLDVDGVEHELAAWVRDGQKGKFMSLSVKPKEQRSAAGEYESERRQDARRAQSFSDDPF